MAVIVPITIGSKNVYIPNIIPFVLFCLNVFKSISSPDRNIMYNTPTLPNSSKLSSFFNMLSPYGPNSIPASISPIICGILILFNIGAANIMSKTRRKIGIGSDNGNVGNVIKLSSIFSLIY